MRKAEEKKKAEDEEKRKVEDAKKAEDERKAKEAQAVNDKKQQDLMKEADELMKKAQAMKDEASKTITAEGEDKIGKKTDDEETTKRKKAAHARYMRYYRNIRRPDLRLILKIIMKCSVHTYAVHACMHCMHVSLINLDPDTPKELRIMGGEAHGIVTRQQYLLVRLCTVHMWKFLQPAMQFF